ncbi:MAG: hypothetical protein ACP5G0_00940 [Desulfomonilia bacterium]
MKAKYVRRMRYALFTSVCCVIYAALVLSCGGNSSDHVQTWKDAFPALWSTAYAQDAEEPNPEDITYEEFLQAVIGALQSDQAFLSQIQGERGLAGPQGPTGPEGPEGPQGEPGTCSCPITQGELDALLARIAELETKLASVSVGDDINGYAAITFSGVNVHIVSGSGSTDGVVNGLGNLIVGYNELRGSGDDRSGSHTIVVGSRNNYSSYGGFIAGYLNSISQLYASVSGGLLNTANGEYASVSGGSGNTSSGYGSSISGGASNTASGPGSSIGGGASNTASGNCSTISAGEQNTASGDYSIVSGGIHNIASGGWSFVGGGGSLYINETPNEAFSRFSAILGGSENVVGDVSSGDHTIGEKATIVGGYRNEAWGEHASIAGGYFNDASGQYSSVSGGHQNIAAGSASSISGGRENTGSGYCSSVSGGRLNAASSHYASVSGGENNTAFGNSSSVSGGYYNNASAWCSSLSGGCARGVSDQFDWRAGSLWEDQ